MQRKKPENDFVPNDVHWRILAINNAWIPGLLLLCDFIGMPIAHHDMNVIISTVFHPTMSHWMSMSALESMGAAIDNPTLPNRLG